MVPLILGWLVAAAAAADSLGARAAEGFGWVTATPESQGLSTTRLDAFRIGQAARGTIALLVVRHDKIVYEWYAPGTSASTLLGTASTAKALIGGMAMAVMLDAGLVTLDAPVARWIPEWREDPLKSKITLRQLGSHTSGLDDAEEGDLPHAKLEGWKGDFWKQPPVPRDPFTLSRDVVPIRYAPGADNSYSNPGIAMLTYTLTAALVDAPQKDVRTLLRERIMRPIGIGDREWAAGYNKTFVVNGLPLVAAWGGGSFTARAMARIGRLTLHEGNWDGKRVVSAAAIHAVVDHAALPGDCGIGWWTNARNRVPEMPHDAYYAAGAGHRLVVVIPSLDAIVVRNGQLLDNRTPYFEAQRRFFFVPMMEALAQERPAPSKRAGPAPGSGR